MTKLACLFALFATTLLCTLSINPAQAVQRDRVFVASYGNDANPCTFGSPCKTFSAALSAVAAGGEVTAIDSAGFGPVTITKAVTITSPAGIEAGVVPVAGGDAVTINAGGGDAIVLRGLTLNGSGAGYNGIHFNTGGSLTVTDCVVQNFVENGSNTATGNGIFLNPSANTNLIIITNTIVSNNGYAGIYFLGTGGTSDGSYTIDRVTATGNQYGISLDASHNSTSTIDVAISNSVASANSVDGIFANNVESDFRVSIDNSAVNGNKMNGIDAEGVAEVVLGRSVLTGNIFGIKNNTSPNMFFTHQDNRIDLNNNGDTTDGANPSSKPFQ